jgi:sec-independent protein translocase protein TatB
MFDIGFWELFLILILALLIVGPERLPKAARTAGYWFGKARRYVEGVKEEVASEFDVTELKRMVHNQEVQINELQSQLKETVSFDEEPQATSEPDYEILEEKPAPADETSRKNTD